MEIPINLHSLLYELETIKNEGTLDTKEKREHQVRVFLANCGGYSDSYKPLVSSITQSSMELQSFIREQNLDLVTIIETSSYLDIKSKELLLGYTEDLNYLKPVGGNVPLLPGLEFTPETIEAIKTWGIIISSFCLASGFIPSTISTILDISIKLQQIKINKLTIKEKTNKRSK